MKEYFIFGKEACRLMEEGFPLEEILILLYSCDATLYVFEGSAEDLLRAYEGYGAYKKISENTYNVLLNFLVKYIIKF